MSNDGDVQQVVAGHQTLAPLRAALVTVDPPVADAANVQEALEGLLPMEWRDENGVVRLSINASAGLESSDLSFTTFDADSVPISGIQLANNAISAAIGGTNLQINADGSASLTKPDGTGLTMLADGTIKLGVGDLLTINPDYSYSLNGAQLIEALATGLFLHLPTSDPAVAGALWNDAGTVKVSAG